MQANSPLALMVLAVAAVLSAPLASAAAGGAAASGATASGATSDEALAAQVDASGPYQLVQSAADALLKALDAHRADYRQDPSKLRALVDRVLLPHFDTQLAAKLVLGRHWNTATPEQRQRFIDAFIKSMLNNYGKALLDFTSNRLKVLPFRGQANAPYATVNSQIRKDDGSVVAVNYDLDHTDQGWKVFNVVIEGVSYVKSFQQDFGEQIDREGLDAVIARLERGEVPAAVQKTTGKT
jgi:phospholipid transport system substrate-binding protein